jgi:hypothetical protein
MDPTKNSAFRRPSKQSNYFAYKTNGVELGRMFGIVDQHFLMTHSSQTQLGRHRIEIERTPTGVRVWVDEKLSLDFRNRIWPNALYDHHGSIGLYVEDAEVIIENVEIQEISSDSR